MGASVLYSAPVCSLCLGNRHRQSRVGIEREQFFCPPPLPHRQTACAKCCTWMYYRESDTRFSTSAFFMNQCPLGQWVLPWGRFEFFRKFAKIFSNECLSPVLTTPAISCSLVSTTPAINLSPVSINPCHGFSVIAGVIDTADKIDPRCRWYRSEITKKPKIYRRCQRHRR